MSSLTPLHLSPSAAESRAWSLSSSGLLSINFYFLTLVQFIKFNPVLPSQFFVEIKSSINGQGVCLVSGAQESEH